MTRLTLFPILCAWLLAASQLPAQRPNAPTQAGEVNTPPARGERLNDKVKVGDNAPDFTLPLLDGKGKVTLSTFEGKKPVVLIFGSYT